MNKRRNPLAATFRSAAELFHADTCEPLEAAVRRGEVRVTALGRGAYPGRRLPARDLCEVRSAGCWNAPGRQSWGLDWHRNEGIELTFLAAGRLPFAVDRRAAVLEPGDFTITRPWQRHRVGDPRVSASRLIWLILDVGVRRPNQAWRWPRWLLLPPARLQRLTHQLRHNESISWRADRETARCFAQIGTLTAVSPGPANLARLKIAINELLLALDDLFQQRRPRLNVRLSSTERTVKLFLKELADRCDEPWTLEAMAEQCGLGRSQFSQYCQKLTNRTPVDWLTDCRVERAAEMLCRPDGAQITAVAYACGFQSSQYFATVFARRKGCNPRLWRARWRSSRPG